MLSHWNLNPACLPIPPCPRVSIIASDLILMQGGSNTKALQVPAFTFLYKNNYLKL